MNILIICSSGMSSSVLVSNMQEAALKLNVPAKIEALGRDESSQISLNYDVILLAPQVRYQKDRFLRMTNNAIPIEIIDTVAYGTLNGEKVIKQAIEILQK